MAIEIVEFPIKNGGSFHGKMLVHQAGYLHPDRPRSTQIDPDRPRSTPQFPPPYIFESVMAGAVWVAASQHWPPLT